MKKWIENVIGAIFFIVCFSLCVCAMYVVMSVLSSAIERDINRREDWRVFEEANEGKVQIVAVAGSDELLVEVKGVRNQEERIVRQHQDNVRFPHIPVVGQKWKLHMEGIYLQMERLE